MNSVTFFLLILSQDFLQISDETIDLVLLKLDLESDECVWSREAWSSITEEKFPKIRG